MKRLSIFLLFAWLGSASAMQEQEHTVPIEEKDDDDAEAFPPGIQMRLEMLRLFLKYLPDTGSFVETKGLLSEDPYPSLRIKHELYWTTPPQMLKHFPILGRLEEGPRWNAPLFLIGINPNEPEHSLRNYAIAQLLAGSIAKKEDGSLPVIRAVKERLDDIKDFATRNQGNKSSDGTLLRPNAIFHEEQIILPLLLCAHTGSLTKVELQDVQEYAITNILSLFAHHPHSEFFLRSLTHCILQVGKKLYQRKYRSTSHWLEVPSSEKTTKPETVKKKVSGTNHTPEQGDLPEKIAMQLAMLRFFLMHPQKDGHFDLTSSPRDYVEMRLKQTKPSSPGQTKPLINATWSPWLDNRNFFSITIDPEKLQHPLHNSAITHLLKGGGDKNFKALNCIDGKEDNPPCLKTIFARLTSISDFAKRTREIESPDLMMVLSDPPFHAEKICLPLTICSQKGTTTTIELQDIEEYHPVSILSLSTEHPDNGLFCYPLLACMEYVGKELYKNKFPAKNFPHSSAPPAEESTDIKG